MILSKLYHSCAYDVEYQVVGDDVNYAFVEDDDVLYIFFQGSRSVSDWLRNFLFPARPYKDMKIPYRVHRGFLAAWKEVEDIIIKKITEQFRVQLDNTEAFSKYYSPELDFDYKWKHIIVVGYSHGGALAAFCHECVWFYRPDLRKDGLEGYGFGAPRIYAGWHVKKALKERWEKFVVIRDNNDIVTHLPPILFRFCHVGNNIIKVHGDTKLVEGWYPKCVKSHLAPVVYDGLVKYELDKKLLEGKKK